MWESTTPTITEVRIERRILSRIELTPPHYYSGWSARLPLFHSDTMGFRSYGTRYAIFLWCIVKIKSAPPTSNVSGRFHRHGMASCQPKRAGAKYLMALVHEVSMAPEAEEASRTLARKTTDKFDWLRREQVSSD